METMQPVAAPRSRRRLVAGVAALLAVVIAVGVILAVNVGGGHPAKAAGPSAGAATVTRRDLVSTDTESGTMSYANPQTVYDRLTGTITWLPATGQVIKPGQALYDVNGQPVMLFDGTFPAYRDLGPGVSDGLDVLQLNRNLVSLGFADGEITVNDTWQAGTTAAVERWQASLGETETGTIKLGQIVFLPGPQRITQVNTSLGSDGSANGSGSGSGSSVLGPVSPARPEFVSLTTPTHPSAQASPTTPTSTAPASCKRAGASTSTPPTSSSPASSTTPTSHCGGSGKPGSGGKSNLSAQELQALIALLKAETLALGKNKSSPSPSSGSGSGAGSGNSGGSPSGSPSGASSGHSGSGSGNSGSGSGNSGSGSGNSGSGSGNSGSGNSGSGNSGSGSGDSGSGASDGGAAPQAILDTTSTQLVVTVDLDASKQSEARVGAPVTVEMPDGTTVHGKITHVSPVAQNSGNSGSGNSGSGNSGGGGGSGSSPTIPVTIALRGHIRTQGLDQATVSVNFEQQVANNVLSVPVTALVATQGGGYAVQEAAPPHNLIPVTTGLFAAGYVEVSGPGLYPGLQVTDSQG